MSFKRGALDRFLARRELTEQWWNDYSHELAASDAV